MPLGIVDYFLVPNYWYPDSLFGLMKVYGVGVESFFFLFVMSGISAVAYQFLNKKKKVKLASSKRRHLGFLFLVIVTYIISSILSPENSVYYLMLAGAAGAILTGFYRPDLRQQILASAFLFSFIYFVVFVVINLVFKGWVQEFYHLKNTWGILVLGVPLEEIGVAFFAGSFWSTIYEYTKSYRG